MPLTQSLTTLLAGQDMEISSIRLRNLAILMDQYDSLAEFADKVDTNPTYLSQCRSENLKANVGSKLARKIERQLGLPTGWMDVDQSMRGRAPTFADIKVIFTVRALSNTWNNCPIHSREQAERMNQSAFCIQVRGDGFGTALRSGCGLILDPKAAVKPLEWVYMERADDHQATVAQVLQSSEEEIVCLPINGGSQFTVLREEIRCIFVVIAILPPAQVSTCSAD